MPRNIIIRVNPKDYTRHICVCVNLPSHKQREKPKSHMLELTHDMGGDGSWKKKKYYCKICGKDCNATTSENIRTMYCERHKEFKHAYRNVIWNHKKRALNPVSHAIDLGWLVPNAGSRLGKNGGFRFTTFV